MDLKLEEDLNAIIKMQPLFGRQANLVWAYVSLFGVTPMKAKLGELGVEMTPALYRVAFEY